MGFEHGREERRRRSAPSCEQERMCKRRERVGGGKVPRCPSAQWHGGGGGSPRLPRTSGAAAAPPPMRRRPQCHLMADGPASAGTARPWRLPVDHRWVQRRQTPRATPAPPGTTRPRAGGVVCGEKVGAFRFPYPGRRTRRAHRRGRKGGDAAGPAAARLGRMAGATVPYPAVDTPLVARERASMEGGGEGGVGRTGRRSRQPRHGAPVRVPQP